jgi:hypothetical protein
MRESFLLLFIILCTIDQQAGSSERGKEREKKNLFCKSKNNKKQQHQFSFFRARKTLAFRRFTKTGGG